MAEFAGWMSVVEGVRDSGSSPFLFAGLCLGHGGEAERPSGFDVPERFAPEEPRGGID